MMPPNCSMCGKFMHKSDIYNPLSDIPMEKQEPWKLWICLCGSSRDRETLEDLDYDG